MEYLGDIEKAKAVREITRVTKENGNIAILTHHPSSPLISSLKENLEQDPKNDALKFYVKCLSEGTFKSEEECYEFFRKFADVKYLGVWNVKLMTPGEAGLCYEIHLKNTRPLKS